MKVYNVETYNKDGSFYRIGDWGVDSERVTESKRQSYTLEAPIESINEKIPVKFSVIGFDSNGWAIGEWIACPEDAPELRISAIEKLDAIVCQINRYELLGKDATKTKEKLISAMAKIDAKFPEA